jgi:hypothetical protein
VTNDYNVEKIRAEIAILRLRLCERTRNNRAETMIQIDAFIALMVYTLTIGCMIIVTVSLMRIAVRLGQLVDKFDDIKHELEEMKQKQKQTEPQS